MKCPKCQHDNTARAKFCEECAASLARPDMRQLWKRGVTHSQVLRPVWLSSEACTDDPRFASPTSYTPRHLADKILNSRAALEGERKLVTVLFADIKGSMDLIADRDPEDAQKILDPVLERMIEAVHRYEGTVNRVMGDGIMALFGAPIAHEDHAVRACYAALRMQETVKRYADEVQRARRGGDDPGRTQLGGDPRLRDRQRSAHGLHRRRPDSEPGGSHGTDGKARFRAYDGRHSQLAEGYIAMKPLGPVSVKGLADLVEVYEVTGAGAARTRLQAAAGRGLTRFVGRDVELEQLRRAQQLPATVAVRWWRSLVKQGWASRAWCTNSFIRTTTAGWLILESGSVSYGHATPYLPVIGLLRHYFKINVQDSTRSIREKVTRRILALDPRYRTRFRQCWISLTCWITSIRSGRSTRCSVGSTHIRQ